VSQFKRVASNTSLNLSGSQRLCSISTPHPWYCYIVAINADVSPPLNKQHYTPPFVTSVMASSSSNVVGVHYRVGKKIGEGSFGVLFEGTNLLNNQQVAIKFVRYFR
jgi:hypothetical protein